MKIAIFGGLGYLGSKLTDFFFTSRYKNNQFFIEENEFEDEFENLISYLKKYKKIYN